MTEALPTAHCSKWWLVLALLLGGVLRVGVMGASSGDLTDDRDGYLGLAEGLREGKGYVTPGTKSPTGFRPPLYPLWLSLNPLPGLGMGDVKYWVGFSNLLFGMGTILLTYQLGKRLGLSEVVSTLAAGLIAVDPLLLRYSALPMTECMSTLLVVALLWKIAQPATGWKLSAVTGLLFGANVLCRPTVWVFGGLMLVSMTLRCIMRRGPGNVVDADATTSTTGNPRLRWLACGLGIVLMVGPWVVRNYRQFDRFILNTTHGGYTLLLGNNRAFYNEVVRQPWGTVWDGTRGPGQEAWYRDVLEQMRVEGVQGEVAMDRWQQQLAHKEIAADRTGFLQAAMLRFARFWNVVPLGEQGGLSTVGVRWGIGGYYLFVLGSALMGIVIKLQQLWHRESLQWLPPMLMILAFTLVHLVYWSNARMRAPVMPIVALVAVGMCAKRIPGRQDCE